jgi:hypothetical protein
MATLGGMDESWGDYWRKVCAPKLMAKKKELGRKVPEREIAAYVEANSGKPSERGLVSLWLLGLREPYISQFFALCKKLEMDPHEVLTSTPPPKSPKKALNRVNERTAPQQKVVVKRHIQKQ